MKPRIVFMGSPELASTILASVSTRYLIYGVVTQPDRPAGRGKQLTPPPVKVLAQELGCRIMQPEKLRLPENFEILKEWAPDIILVAAYGQILRQNVLDLPRLGCINVHASLLPRWRGAAPIQAAILNGDAMTGVSIMKMDAGIDTGPVYATRNVMIDPADNTLTLSNKLARTGGELLLGILPEILQGTATAKPQPAEGATYAGMLKKEDGLLDFNQPGQALVNRIHAYYPWPGTFLLWDGQPMKVINAVFENCAVKPAGTRMVKGGFPAIACADGLLRLEEVQPAGKRPMNGKVFVNGARNWEEA
jgi:methionyl-tRNA formyltransferase